MMIWCRTGEIRSWSCKEWLSFNELFNADKQCPLCDMEIDTEDSPNIAEPQKPTNGQSPNANKS